MYGIKFQNININLIVLVLYLFWFLLIGYQNLFEPFVADDLHLIREYSSKHLLNVWFDNWDPDNIETISYRPLAIWYYHLQSLIFGENTFLLGIFINLTQLVLVFVILIFFKKLKFSNEQIFFLFVILIFSKIFTTIVTWKTLNPLIFCYINFFLASIYYLKWIDTGKFKNISLLICFSFICIFSREELYHLPFYLLALGLFYINSTISKEIKRIFTASFAVLLIVGLHYYLRSNFLSGASEIKITISGIKGILISGVASGLPGGLIVTNLLEIFLQAIWILSILILFLVYCKRNYKEIDQVKKFFILFIIVCFLTSPSMIIIRDFGIFLPSVFTYAMIALIFSNILNYIIDKNFRQNLIIIIFSISVISGIVGGLYRSFDHVNMWKHNSLYNLSNDSVWIFGYTKEEVTIPNTRREFKKAQLSEYGIYEKLNYDQLISKINKKLIKNKIIIPRHFPLKY